MKVIAIAIANLKRFARDRGNLFFVFILPIGIILLIGAQFGAGGATRIGVYDPGGSGPVGAEIVADLGREGFATVDYDSRGELVRAVERGYVAVGVAFPAEMAATLAAGGTANIEYLSDRPAEDAAIQAVVSQSVVAATEEEVAIRYAIARGATRPMAEAALAMAAPQVPVVTVVSDTAGEALFAGAGSAYEVGAAGQLVLFMFVTALAGAAALIQTRRLGLSRRMLSTPTSTATILTGEALGRLIIILVQGVYVIAITALMFQVEWGNLLATGAILLMFALVATGAAMLFGTLFSHPGAAAGAGVTIALAIAALGGAMLPIELFGDTLRTVAHATPHAWALDAFTEVLRRDGGIGDILPELGVLAAFAVVLLALATWRMRIAITRS